MTTDLVRRLHGRYPVGPLDENGYPEFGYRTFEGLPPINAEAADTIQKLTAALAYYADPEHWNSGDVPGHIYAIEDGGGFAREALGLPRIVPDKKTWEISIAARKIWYDSQLYV